MKRCACCGREKPLDQFSPGKARCKPCRSAEVSAAYRANPEPVKAAARQWYRKNADREYFVRRVRIETNRMAGDAHDAA